MSERWVFECTECGEQWVNPEAPIAGHPCDWQGEGIPPEDEVNDVEVVESPVPDQGVEHA